MAKRVGARSWGTIKKLPSGNYRASYTGPDGAIHAAPHTFVDKMFAERWLVDERSLIDRDTWTPPRRRRQADADRAALTVAAYAATWLARPGLAPATRRDYDQALRLHVLPRLGDVPLHELTKAAVASWWRDLDHSKPRACDKAYAALRTMCRAAADEDLITTDPCQVRRAGRASRHRTIEPLTPAQVRAVADAMPSRRRLAVLLGAWCGLRSGEVRELRRRDVDVAAGVVRITRATIRVKGETIVAGPKTEAGRRTLQIPAAILPDVKTHLRDWAQLGDNGLLFYAVDGRQLSEQSLLQSFKAACRTAGNAERLAAAAAAGADPDTIPAGLLESSAYWFHDLRRTGLTYAAVAGATIRELQAIAGHTTPAMAMRYQEVARDHLAQVIDGMSALIEAARPA